MIRTILVPLDRSPFGERALPFAECLAQTLNANLVLVESVYVHVLPGADPTDAQVRAMEEAAVYLNDIAARIRAKGIEVEVATPYGNPVEEILEEVSLRDADLVVMATHGRSGLGRWVYGSVAEGVLHSSPVPVLLLQAWQGERPWRCMEEQPRLIVPLDGSPFAEAALPLAMQLAGQLGGGLVLLHALDVPNEPLVVGPMLPVEVPLQDVETLAADAREYLGRVAALVTRESGVVPTVEVREGGAAEAIADASREDGAALVVMSSHGRSGVARSLFGSVAGATLRQSSAPLLLVRPGMPLAPTQEPLVAGASLAGSAAGGAG